MHKQKRRRVAQENREFNSAWCYLYAFTCNAAGLPVCLICGESLAHNKKYNLERHFHCKHAAFAAEYQDEGDRRQIINELMAKADEGGQQHFATLVAANAKKQEAAAERQKMAKSTTAASFVAAQEIVRRGRPFTDGEYLKESFLRIAEHLFVDFPNKVDIVRKIKDMPLSSKTFKDRAVKMAANITSQQVEDINASPALSIALQECRDSHDLEQVALMCRYIGHDGPQEEVIEMLPLRGGGGGHLQQNNDVCEAVVECLLTQRIRTAHLVSVTTSGGPPFTSSSSSCSGVAGLVQLLQNTLDRRVLVFHCLSQQELLCAQLFPAPCAEQMALLVQIVSKLSSMAKSAKLQLGPLMDALSTAYSSDQLPLHYKVAWLASGELLKQFSNSLRPLKGFLDSKGLFYPQLEDGEWQERLAFMADITSHLAIFSTSLKTHGNMALQMVEEVNTFNHKLAVLAQDLSRGALTHHFPTLNSLNRDINLEQLAAMIGDIQACLGEKFAELKQEQATLSFPLTPLNVDAALLTKDIVADVDHAQLEEELSLLADNDLLVAKFHSLTASLENVARQNAILAQHEHCWADTTNDNNVPRTDRLVFETWSAIPDDTFANMKKYALGILTIFGSTNLPESVFKSMNEVKGKNRSRMTEDSLQSCVKIQTTSYSPNIDEICSEIQAQKSH